MTLRVPGANGTASHRGRNASTPTSAFALHENEQPPPFPARSTNSPSCLLLLPPFPLPLPLPSPPRTPLFHDRSRINNTDFRSLHRMSVYHRFISPDLSLHHQNPSPLRSLAHFTLRNKFATLCRFLRVPLLDTINSIRNFRRNITFSPNEFRFESIDSERKIYNLFPRVFGTRVSLDPSLPRIL